MWSLPGRGNKCKGLETGVRLVFEALMAMSILSEEESIGTVQGSGQVRSWLLL